MGRRGITCTPNLHFDIIFLETSRDIISQLVSSSLLAPRGFSSAGFALLSVLRRSASVTRDGSGKAGQWVILAHFVHYLVHLLGPSRRIAALNRLRHITVAFGHDVLAQTRQLFD